MVDTLFVLMLVAVCAAGIVPQTISSVHQARTRAAARYLSSRMALARAQAVSRSATVALRFDEDETGFKVSVVADGNRNGVRAADIASGVDRRIESPVRLSDLFPRVFIALSEAGAALDPVRIGTTTLMSFTPRGTATPGSIYLRGDDGTQYAVRVLGATGRTRVLRYRATTHDWVDLR